MRVPPTFASLTRRERDVARLAGLGYPEKRIAATLNIAPSTVHGTIAAIFLRLDNPDELPAKTLVTLWAAHQLWLEQQQQSA